MANKFRVQDGIVFPDGTEMNSATTIYDQPLNTTDNVTFNSVNTPVVYAPVGTALEL